MYGKVFTSIYDSTLMSDEGWLGVYVFSSMVVLADKDGVVNMDDRALFRRLGLDYDDEDLAMFHRFMKVIEILEAPDPNSNLGKMDGKRLVRLSELEDFDDNRGWLIVNYAYYLKKGSREERNEYKRGYMAAIRKLGSDNKDVDTCVTSCNPVTNVKQIDVDVDVKKNLVSPSSKLGKSPVEDGGFVQVATVKGQPKKEIPDTKKLILHFYELLGEKMDGTATVTWGMDTKAAKRVLKDNSLGELKALAHDYFDMIEAKYWTFTHFCSTKDRLKCMITYETEKDPLATSRSRA